MIRLEFLVALLAMSVGVLATRHPEINAVLRELHSGRERISAASSSAITTVLAEIGPQFEHTTGHTLTVVSGPPNDFAEPVP
jgi:ABC-type molybdate transport system substrate-binding protein